MNREVSKEQLIQTQFELAAHLVADLEDDGVEIGPLELLDAMARVGVYLVGMTAESVSNPLSENIASAAYFGALNQVV